jgi:hypothetical protein
MSVRRAALATTVMIGFVLALGSLAWACTDFTKIDSIIPATNPAAATAAVKGSGAAAGSMVALRWNALNGPVIAQAQADESGAFSADAKIPDVPAGIYTVIASDGKSSVGRVPYEVGAAGVSGASVTPGAAGDLKFTAKTSPGLSAPSASPLSAAMIVVFGGGLVALASGAALMTTRRRKALATR